MTSSKLNKKEKYIFSEVIPWLEYVYEVIEIDKSLYKPLNNCIKTLLEIFQEAYPDDKRPELLPAAFWLSYKSLALDETYQLPPLSYLLYFCPNCQGENIIDIERKLFSISKYTPCLKELNLKKIEDEDLIFSKSSSLIPSSPSTKVGVVNNKEKLENIGKSIIHYFPVFLFTCGYDIFEKVNTITGKNVDEFLISIDNLVPIQYRNFQSYESLIFDYLGYTLQNYIQNEDLTTEEIESYIVALSSIYLPETDFSCKNMKDKILSNASEVLPYSSEEKISKYLNDIVYIPFPTGIYYSILLEKLINVK